MKEELREIIMELKQLNATIKQVLEPQLTMHPNRIWPEPPPVVTMHEGSGKIGWMRVEKALTKINEYEFLIENGGRLQFDTVMEELKGILMTYNN